MAFKLAEESAAKIKVIGIGGGGCNAINTMVEQKLQGVQFIAANTDVQVLDLSKIETRIRLGPSVTKGLGAGANPAIGQEAAEESVNEIRAALEGSDMVFITAGMGGGTGTGAAPVVARISKELGALTVGVVTKPFKFEGKTRMNRALQGWAELKEHVDTIITIPNDRLLSLTQKGAKFVEMMKVADMVLLRAVQGISDLINMPGYINLDFADVRTVMNQMGLALMGTGEAVGEKRAIDAANMAISSPLLEDVNIEGAKGVLINISCSRESLTMHEVEQASSRIQEEVHEDANIFFGAVFDDNLKDALRVTVIATGIRSPEQVAAKGEAAEEQLRGPGVRPIIFPGDHRQHITPNRVNVPQPAKVNRRRMQYSDIPLDENTLEVPTFLRRNES